MSACLVSAQEKKSQYEFSCVIWAELPYKDLYYSLSGEPVLLDLEISRRSPIYPYKSRNEKMVEFFAKELDDEGNVTYKMVGKTKYHDDTKKMLFFISKAKKGSELPLKIFGIDDSTAAFPIGSYRVANFSTASLEVEIGGDKKTIAPRAINIIRANIPKQGGFIPFFIRNKEGSILHETRLYGAARGRKMIFVANPIKSGGRLTIKFIPQIVPFPKAKSPE